MQRKSLSEILNGHDRARFAESWQAAKAAEEYTPLPAGMYECRLVGGELFTSRINETPGYKLTFEVCAGKHDGRRLWHDLWLTPAALPMTKRDLGKLGITSVEQLEAPVPKGIVCQVRVALRCDDDGTEYNRVRSFDVLRIEEPEADPFAPEGDEAVAEGDISFDPAELESSPVELPAEDDEVSRPGERLPQSNARPQPEHGGSVDD